MGEASNERKAEMRVIRILAVCALAASCARDAPMAPGSSTDLATEQFAALAADLTDAQEWLLPSLGHGDVTTDAIGGRFADLATSLARADTAVFACHSPAGTAGGRRCRDR